MVAVKTGDIESARFTPKEEWARLVEKWQGVAYFFPDDCRKLKQMRDECEELCMWQELGYESEEAFFQDGLLLDFRVVELACLALGVADEDGPVALEEAVSKGEKIARRREAVKADYATGVYTQPELANKHNVSLATIERDLSSPQKVSHDTKREGKQKRRTLVYQISEYTKAETAAAKIHDKFGPDFAKALKEAL